MQSGARKSNQSLYLYENGDFCCKEKESFADIQGDRCRIKTYAGSGVLMHIKTYELSEDER